MKAATSLASFLLIGLAACGDDEDGSGAAAPSGQGAAGDDPVTYVVLLDASG